MKIKEDYRIDVLRKLIKIEKVKQEGTTITLDYIDWLETKLGLLLSSEKNLLAEVSKCKICKKKLDFDLLSVECPDCYLKGCKKELEKQKTEVGKVIFVEKDGMLFYRFQNPDKLKQKLGIQ